MNKILVTGGGGLVASALKKHLEANYILSSEYDLRDAAQCASMFEKYKPEKVIHLAGKVGGIAANQNKLADFFYDNITINTNVLHFAKEYGVKKVLSMMSSCIYPSDSSYPLLEKNIHNGEPHSSNFAYAYAKRMLDVQSRAYRQQYGCNFITASPNNIFGENDNFDIKNSHVIPAIIRKVYEAKQKQTDVVLWGDGSPLREFTYSGDIAKIILFLLENYNEQEPINIGSTKEHSIKEVAEYICDIFDYKGKIEWQKSELQGQLRKPSDNSKLLHLGWKEEEFSDFKNNLKNVCKWFEQNYPNVRGYI